MWSKDYWKAVTERAIKTFAQTLVPLVTATLFTQPDWSDITAAVGLSACAAGISILTSMASTLRGDPESPSLIRPAGRHSATDLG
ncbi:holin [Nocardia abscessus]|uniref:holin n=1 Tax=Nocardia abscessus TaxID=120957 RepID=UPI002454DBCE|nr:holin [Nocardia abscessus]